jgi:raffinose/stachyose/melibiose transport system substrate-binding protein
LLTAQGSNDIRQLVDAIALNTVYVKDRHWAEALRAGTATFEGTPGWRQALQELIDMNSAGCFQPGAAATTAPSGDAQFAQGQSLMYFQAATHKGTIDASNPQFAYSLHPFPAVTDRSQTVGAFSFANSVSVNAHSSAQNQTAAQAFVDFIARPDQAALHARLDGGVSEYQLASGRFPTYLSSFATLSQEHRLAIDPVWGWWNASVANALATYGTGLLTGQTTIDDVLKTMDAAWKLGPD